MGYPVLQSQARQGRSPRHLAMLALANLIWASQGVAVKYLNRHMGPIAIAFLPFWAATILLIPVLRIARRRNPNATRPGRRDWLAFAAAGIGGQFIAQLGMTWGITKSLVSNAAVLNLLIPVISALLASIMLKERLTPLRLVSFALGLAGVLLLSVEDLRHSALFASRLLTGNGLILAGCLGSAFYNVYCKRLMRRFGEVEILVFSYIFASLASGPLLIWFEPFPFGAFTAFDWKSWLAFVFLAIFMYGVSMLLFFDVLQHLDVTVASASLYLIPVFGVILGAVLLGERLSLLAIGGAVTVVGASVMIMRYDKP